MILSSNDIHSVNIPVRAARLARQVSALPRTHVAVDMVSQDHGSYSEDVMRYSSFNLGLFFICTKPLSTLRGFVRPFLTWTPFKFLHCFSSQRPVVSS